MAIAEFGLKPFKIFNHWIRLDDFDLAINKSWHTGEYRGVPYVVTKNNIKALRADIKIGGCLLLETNETYKKSIVILEIEIKRLN